MGNAATTKTAVLDAAEALFAESGYDGVSMRDIAVAAKTHLGLLTYHFGTKENLFEVVIARRADLLNDRRRASLAATIASSRRPSVEAIVDAYLRPHLQLILEGGAGWRSYGRLIAQSGQSPRWGELIARHFGDVARDCIDLIIAADPALTRELGVRGYVYMVSVVVGVFASSGILDTLSDAAHTSEDLEAAYSSMVAFVAGGFHALAAGRDAEVARPRVGNAPRLTIARDRGPAIPPDPRPSRRAR
jgi:AcrR family transcriptional regulator